ncbi:AraC family transcriptional regulator [Desulfovibrio intestinalis]|uniref:AraC-like DNA-binding protein n=1 Tax=Desulfovibrio intestinalis TaxID=58621 RepID=A0A7W8BYC5_9BACT|nr:AraC family transcriptional regulator [Desulfovibrio intestinalis]MBB5142238.1 AraC-like DNA-binding protein [Desulfovibrio intestinalis]
MQRLSCASQARPVQQLPLPQCGLWGMQIMPGITLNIMDFKPDEEISIDTGLRGDSLEFAFVLSGEAEYRAHAAEKPCRLGAGPDTGIAFYMPDSQGIFSICKKQPVQMLGLSLEAQCLRNLMGLEKAAPLHKALPTNQNSRLNPTLRMLVSQFFSCRKSGVSLELYLQGKALQLLSEVIDEIGREGLHSRSRSCPLNTGDIEHIRRARHLLCAHMTDPPSLPDLAAKVGMNVNKLKAGFQRLYDMAPYRCLHEDRMHKAGQLLEAGDMNVSEVAWAVGYTNVGHFGAAFSKFFGVKPKSYQMDAHRKLGLRG